jgi:hypothetical protein
MYYIGSHWGTDDDGYICSSNRMRDAYRRRPDDFKRRILSRVYTNRSDLLQKEQDWFDRVKHRDRYYNLNWNTQNGFWYDDTIRYRNIRKRMSESHKGKTHTDETKKKMSLMRQGELNSNYGNIYSPETRIKMSNSQKGKFVSQETKNKLSKAHQNRTYSEDRNAKVSASLTGRKLSPEHISNMSKAAKGPRPNRRKEYKLISPDGNFTHITDLKTFCQDNDLNYGSMQGMFHRSKTSYASYKGWTVAKPTTPN